MTIKQDATDYVKNNNIDIIKVGTEGNKKVFRIIKNGDHIYEISAKTLGDAIVGIYRIETDADYRKSSREKDVMVDDAPPLKNNHPIHGLLSKEN